MLFLHHQCVFKGDWWMDKAEGLLRGSSRTIRKDTVDVNVNARTCSERGNSLARTGRVNFSLIDRPDTELAYVRQCTYERARRRLLYKVSPNGRVPRTKRAFDDKYSASSRQRNCVGKNVN